MNLKHRDEIGAYQPTQLFSNFFVKYFKPITILVCSRKMSRNKGGEFPSEENKAQKDYEQRYYMKKTEEVAKVIEKEQIKLEAIKEKKRKRKENKKNRGDDDDLEDDDENDDDDFGTSDEDEEEEEEKPKKKPKKEKPAKQEKPEKQEIQEKPAKKHTRFEKVEIPISQKSFEEAKLDIAQLSTEILHDPVANVRNLKQILDVTKESKLFQVQQLCILSLLALFLDLIPDYRIDVAQIDEVKVKLFF
jgi:hypothetical protein